MALGKGGAVPGGERSLRRMVLWGLGTPSEGKKKKKAKRIIEKLQEKSPKRNTRRTKKWRVKSRRKKEGARCLKLNLHEKRGVKLKKKEKSLRPACFVLSDHWLTGDSKESMQLVREQTF